MTTADIQAEINRLSIKLASVDRSSQAGMTYFGIITELKKKLPSAQKPVLHVAEGSICEACE